MNEIGFYAMGAWGAEPGRVAAIARHLPNAVVYVVGRSAVKRLFGHHDITTVVPKCATPGCTGLSARDLSAWMRNRDPDRLVMDGQPYGILQDESRPYIEGRRKPTYFLHRRSITEATYNASTFTAVLKADPSPIAGVDLHPVLPFDAAELPTRTEARAALGGGDKPIVMIIGEGNTPNITDFVVSHCQRRGLDHVVVVNTYPVMTLMPGADFIVGYSGYSQVEAEAVGVPMAGVSNLADLSQSWRTNATPTQIAATIAALEVRDAPERVEYTDHSRRAAALIAGYPAWESVDG